MAYDDRGPNMRRRMAGNSNDALGKWKKK